MCIGREFRRTFQDVRVKRGADVASDHHLVARLKLKLRRNWTERTNQRPEYNTFLLNDTNKRKKLSITSILQYVPGPARTDGRGKHRHAMK